MDFNKIFYTRRYYRIAVSSFFFLQGLTFSSWTSRIPDIQKILNLNDAQLGGLLLSMPVGQTLAMILSGYLIGKFNSKKILLFAAVAYPATLTLMGTVTSSWQLTLGLFFFGMFGNICNIAVNTQGVGVERLYNRSIMANFHGIWSLAGFVGGIISTFLAGNSIGPFYHFLIIFSIAIIVILSVRNSVVPRDARKANNTRRSLLARPEKYILLLGLICFGDLYCEGVMFNWGSIYYQKVLALPNEEIRIGFIAFMSTMATGRFIADWLVTRFSARNVIQACGYSVTVGVLITVLFPNLLASTIGYLFIGFGVSSVIPLCYSFAGKSKTLHPGLAVTTVSTIGFIGYLISPPLIGFITEMWNMRIAFATVALFGLLTVFVARKLNQ